MTVVTDGTVWATFYDEVGRITGIAQALPEDHALNGPWVAGHGDVLSQWVTGAPPAIVGRPTTGLPGKHTVPEDVEWTVPNVPAGTIVMVDGVISGTVDGSGLVLEFPVPGSWRVDIMPPWPWVPATCAVEVTPA